MSYLLYIDSLKKLQDMVVFGIIIGYKNLNIERNFTLRYLVSINCIEFNWLEITITKQMETEYKSIGKIDVSQMNTSYGKEGITKLSPLPEEVYSLKFYLPSSWYQDAISTGIFTC